MPRKCTLILVGWICSPYKVFQLLILSKQVTDHRPGTLLEKIGTYQLYSKHYTILIANNASMTQETGQATSLYPTIILGLVAK